MEKNYKLIIAIALLITTIGNVKSIAQCTTPSSPAGQPVLTCATGPNMTLTWTAAGTPSNCNGYVVIRFTSFPANNEFSVSNGTALPTQGTTPYLFAGNFNGYIEYVGSNLTTTTTNLSADTEYYWYIIPYNNGISSCSPAPAYNVNSVAYATNSPNTRPGQVSGVTTGTPTEYTIPDISFPPVSGADGYLVCTDPEGEDGPLYSLPTDGESYNVGDFFDDGSGTPWDQTVQYVGPNTSGITASTGLLPNTTYAITVYAYKNNIYPCSGGPLYVSPISHTTGQAKTALNTGVADDLINISGTIRIYPNPSTEQIVISSSSFKVNEPVVVSVLNLPGELVQTVNIKWVANNTLDVKTLPSGIYFLQVKTSGTSEMQRFVKL